MGKPRKKRKRPESEFLRNFGKSWKSAGGYWYKIPDATGVSAMFSPARPYDILASMNKTPMVIEGKYCKTIQFGLSEMKSHQIPALLEATRAGFEAFTLVCYDRLSGKVADVFTIETLVQAQHAKRQWLSPDEAVLRVYASNATDWMIDPQAILNMTLRQKKLPELFPT